MAILKDWLCGIPYEILQGSDMCEVGDVVFDSRKAAPQTVFVCMEGSKIDSHSFIGDVAAKGCRAIVVEKDVPQIHEDFPADISVLKVESGRRALAQLSAARFGNPSSKMLMIGLTGTKGKTSTSYMLQHILEYCGRRTGVIGTNGVMIRGEHFETRNTTPDSYELQSWFARMLEAGCDSVVMECSSQGFKMDRTAGIVFDYGIFLNISPDHIGPLEHADFAEYLYCKSRLLTQCRTAIVNADDPHTEELVKEAGGGWEKLLRFSLRDRTADLYACDLKFLTGADFTGTAFTACGLMNSEIRLSIPGEFNVSNALGALTAAADLRLPADKVREAMSHIHVDGRMEAVYKSDKFTVIVDYAHNEVSMVNLMATLKKYHPKRLIAVFGCGGNRSRDRRIGMGQAAAKSADFSVFTADNSRFEKTEDIIADIREAYLGAGGDPSAYVEIPDRREAIRYCMANAQQGDMIAVIGKGHEDYQEENGVRRHFLDKEEILKIRDELGL